MTPWTVVAQQAPLSMKFSMQEYSPFQEVLSTQGLNLGLLHCRQILYHLSHQGSHRTTIVDSESCSVISNSLRPHELYSPWNSPGQNTRVGSLSLLQGIFPTQGLDPGLPHRRWILYHVSHQGSSNVREYNLLIRLLLIS